MVGSCTERSITIDLSVQKNNVETRFIASPKGFIMLEAIIALTALIAIIVTCAWWSRNEWKVKAALHVLTSPHPRPVHVHLVHRSMSQATPAQRQQAAARLRARRAQTDGELAEAYMASYNRRNRAA